MVAAAGIGMGLASAGIGAFDLFSGAADQPTPPPNPIPPQPGVQALTGGGPQGISSLPQYNLGGQYMPAYQQALNTYIQNPYGPEAQGAANYFAGGAMGAANQGLTNAGMIGGTVNPLLTAAFDPQSALFQRTAGQVSDRELAQLTQSGLAGTPWGAGAYGQTMSDFGLNWNDRQLQRMLSGVQGAEGAGVGALGLGGGAAQLGAQAGAMPFQTYGGIAGMPMGAFGQASQYGQQAAAVPQTGIGDWLQYLNASTGGQQAANQLYAQQLAAQKQGFGESMALGGMIGGGLGGAAGWGAGGTPGLSQAFGPGGMFGTGTQFMGGGNWLMR
jgi:hypothetical protein